MEHDTPFGNSNQENGPTFLAFPFFLGIFQWDEPTKRVPFTDKLEIPEVLTKWKASIVPRGSSRRSLLFFVPYFSARLDFPSPPLSAPGSPRMRTNKVTAETMHKAALNEKPTDPPQ